MYKLENNVEWTEELKDAFKHNITRATISSDNFLITEDSIQILTEDNIPIITKDNIPRMSSLIFNENSKLKEIIIEDCKYVPNEGFIGQATSRMAKVTLVDIDKNTFLEDEEINIKIGADYNGQTYYIDYGNFIVNASPSVDDTNGQVELTCYDYMIKFNKDYIDRVTYPCTLLQLAQDVCAQAGVKLATTNFANKDFIVENNQFVGKQLRDVLKHISKCAFSWARIGQDNRLYIDFEIGNTVAEEITNKEYKKDSFKKADNYYGPINKVTYGDSDIKGQEESVQDNESISLNGINELVINDNYFAYTPTKRQQLIQAGTRLFGLKYMPIQEMKMIGLAYLDCKDLVSVVDMENSSFTTIPFNHTITYNGILNDEVVVEGISKNEKKYNNKSTESQKNSITERTVDRANQKIQDVVSQIGDRSQKTTTVTQDIDGINSSVESIETDLNDNYYTKTETNSQINQTAGAISSRVTVLEDSSIVDVKVEYALGTSTTVAPTTGWSTTAPAWEQGKHMWQRTVTTLANNTTDISNPVCIDGAKGDPGQDGDNGIGVSELEIQYYLSTSSQTQTGGSWQTTQPTWTQNKYIWTRTKLIWTDNSITYTDPILASSINSANETANSANTTANNVVTNFGTYIEQNANSVKLAWNQITQYIQMAIYQNNATLQIRNENGVLMYLDKNGMHYNQGDGTTLLGNMSVEQVNNKNYISFSLPCEYSTQISNGMAWGMKTPSDGKFHPILFIDEFAMDSAQSDSSYGKLRLKSCDLSLDGMESGIISGNVRMYSNALNGIVFEDVDTGNTILSIIPESQHVDETINILDNISFYKNAGGTKSFKITDHNSSIIMTDDGSLVITNGRVLFGTISEPISFDVYTSGASRFWGDVDVHGNVYANNISSDRRIKENIKDSTASALDIIKKIKHKEFDKKDDNKHYKIGYIAQEMEEIDPNFVLIRPKTEKSEERYYINELPIIATLTKAIQEQQEQIEEMKKEISKLKGGK